MFLLSSEDPMVLQQELQLSTLSALVHGTATVLVSRYREHKDIIYVYT